MKGQKGFVLIELLVVLAVVSMLFVIARPYIVERLETAKAGEVKLSWQAICDACVSYNQDTAGEWPLDLEDLLDDPGVNGWAGPYLSVARVSNPWGGNITLEQDMMTEFKIGTDGVYTTTEGAVLYLELTDVNTIAAKKLDTFIDGQYSVDEGNCQLDISTSGVSAGTTEVKILIYDISKETVPPSDPDLS
jgi:prepilin-type N-terminal cleavage/methylation domain-containing protein